MSRKPITPLQLFKVMISILLYTTASGAWLFFAARDPINSPSDLDVTAAFFGTAVWLIASACLFLLTTTPKSGD